METIQDASDYLRDKVLRSLLRSMDKKYPLSSKTYFKAYRLVYINYSQHNALKLYLLYEEMLRNYCVESIMNNLECESEEFVEALIKEHMNYKYLAFWLKSILRYLERHFVKFTSLETLTVSAQRIFIAEVMNKVNEKLIGVIVEFIQYYRDSMEVSLDLLREGLELYSVLRYKQPELVRKEFSIEWEDSEQVNDYEDEMLKEEILKATEVYYKKKAKSLRRGMDLREYVLALKDVFLHEDRLHSLLLKNFSEKMREICMKEMLITYKEAIFIMLEEDRSKLFHPDNEDLLANMYEVLKRHAETNNKILDMLETYITERGKALVIDTSNIKSPNIIPSILTLDSETDGLISRCFNNDSSARVHKRQAFANFINLNFSVQSAICPYLDNFIKSELSSLADSDLRFKLSDLLRIITCIRDRDVFLNNYSRLLSDRLLSLNYSLDSEICVINSLRDEFGQNSIYKLQRMIQDIHTSQSLMKEFQSVSYDTIDIELEVTVINKGSWPVPNNEGFVGIPDVLKYTNIYNQFYTKKFEGRNLHWMYEMGYMILKTKNFNKSYSLVVSPVQAFVLDLFNKCYNMTLQEIIDAAKLNERKLKASVISLFNPKMRILIKDSPGKQLNSGDIIRVNDEFSYPSVMVNYLVMKRYQFEAGKEDKSVMEDRKYTIDSFIVRVSKTKKIITHTELIAEVMAKCTTFKATPGMIKAQIESLIQREFLKRDDASTDTYIYIQEV